jgi:hypothetical protein
MVKRMLWSTALIAAMAASLPLAAVAQMHNKTLNEGKSQAQSPATMANEEPCLSNHCLFYSGDYDDNGPGPNALWNGYVPSLCVFGTCGVTGIVYIPFEVPKGHRGDLGETDWKRKREWIVEGLFLNTLLQDAGLGISVTSADWSIVRGFKVGGLPTQLRTVCSGTGVPTVTPTGRTGAGISEYTLLITGTKCPNLETGKYWMTLVPTTDAYPYATDVEDNTPANVVGPGMEPPDKAGWYAPAFGYTPFFPTAGMFPNGTKGGCGTDGCDRFSAGIIGTLVR